MADTPMVQPGKTLPFVFCGRSFLAAEIELIHDVVSDFRSLSLTEIARTICELLEWRRPNGRLKNHECRLLLEKLSSAGLVNLPTVRECGPRGPRVVLPTENGKEQELLSGSVGEFTPLTLTVVHSGQESSLWNELVERYHYLGYRVPVGANLRYLVRSDSAKQVLACLLWSSPAWKMAPRDTWIGWTTEARSRNLQLVVNNSRFLIMPLRAGAESREHHSLFVCAATTRGLGTTLRLSAAAFGDAGRQAVSRHQLPSCQLDLLGRDARTWPDGPASRGPRTRGETHLRLPTLSRRATATRKRLSAELFPVANDMT